MHTVGTGTAKTVCLPPYRASQAKRKIVEKQISKMLEDDIITLGDDIITPDRPG